MVNALTALKCIRCGGNIEFHDDDGEQVAECVMCNRTGSVVTGVPPKPVRFCDRTAYYDTHRPEICRDYVELGRKGCMEKWGISSGSFYNIWDRWRHNGHNPPALAGDTRSGALPDPTDERDYQMARRGYQKAVQDWRDGKNIADIFTRGALDFSRKPRQE